MKIVSLFGIFECYFYNNKIKNKTHRLEKESQLKKTINDKVEMALEGIFEGEVRFVAGKKAGEVDGTITFATASRTLHFPLEIKNQVQKYQIPGLQNLASKYPGLIVFASYHSASIRAELKELGINYVDETGNMYISDAELFIYIEGKNRNTKRREKPGDAFTKGGIKLIFELLRTPELVDEPYREMEKRSDVSLYTIHKIMSVLEEGRYVVKESERKRALKKRKELLDRWAVAFHERLKPSLLLGEFEFGDRKGQENWKKMDLSEGKSQWGGAPGAELITNDVLVSEWTIYTREGLGDLVKKYGLRPQSGGAIQVYTAFWPDEETTGLPYVHPVLIYADLISRFDSRDMEIAKTIYETVIESVLGGA